ncbi:7428_t:CDS:2 [Paraglomus brasilianum]|uniref:7428_t:CDS:1 n=1 Tax=Paraglomus brasilianum TaxID=144538 RepID=A0A9N9DFM1_9GLOM|nr:7428_t:CDS:2 [Paraglomus brasilianum]
MSFTRHGISRHPHVLAVTNVKAGFESPTKILLDEEIIILNVSTKPKALKKICQGSLRKLGDRGHDIELVDDGGASQHCLYRLRTFK